jgi:GIY-YIG catalytic domain
MFHYLYCIENLSNGKIYVGKHSTSNLNDNYMGSGRRIKYAIKKYGIGNFKKHILKFCETPEEVLALEKEIVNEEFVRDENTYNLTVGGHGSFLAANLFHEKNPEKRIEQLKIAALHAVEKRNENPILIAKMFEIHSGIFKRLHAEGKIHQYDWTGKHHKKETIQRMQISHCGLHKGSLNSQFGTVWIHHLEQKVSKRIMKEELITCLAQGWVIGRKMKW